LISDKGQQNPVGAGLPAIRPPNRQQAGSYEEGGGYPEALS
jgi:hypothetical protein